VVDERDTIVVDPVAIEFGHELASLSPTIRDSSHN
jgi:hypothetical protein